MYDEYEIDDDAYRNATVRVHTSPPGSPWLPVAPQPRPPGTVAVYPRPPATPPRVIHIGPQGAYPYPYAYGQPYPAPAVNGRTLKMVGMIVDAVGQMIAAIMPLPAAPPPATGNQQADADNQRLYSEALAKHAKLDERIRTLGKVVREALEFKGGVA